MKLDHQSKREESDEATDRLPQGLYLVATPIGAAQDISIRALDALRRADVIAAEDTRRAQKLMSIHGVPRAGRPLIPYHDHSSESARSGLLARIAEGRSVVCVSDAGTPLIADPGWKLAREAIDQDLPVIALPGASALLAALCVSGLPTDRFLFGGFPPPKQAGRLAEFAELAALKATLIFYESPRRLAACLADMAEVWGADRTAVVCRELTKLYEETRRGTVGDLATHYADAGAPKGEIVILVGPPLKIEAAEADVDAALTEALKTHRVKDAAKEVAAKLGLPRRDVYQRALALNEAQE